MDNIIDLVVQVGVSVMVNKQGEYIDQITDIRLVKVQPTGLPGQRLDETIEACKAEARQAAAAF